MSIDPGSKNIGLAISDPTGTIANPFMVLKHRSREEDTDFIAQQVLENQIKLIIVGQSLDDQGEPTYEGRRSARLAKVLSQKVAIPVKLWNESFSTKEAKQARILMGGPRKKRSGHLDAMAAAVILQSYLDVEINKKENSE